ncbi:MAG TPA: hypothetical protein VF544_19845 [Pyrinomonadaceae bacterium]|jgi:hypothetical protein
MRKQKLESDPSTQQTDRIRRTFLTRSVVGGLALLCIPEGRATSAGFSEEGCTGKPSASDALNHFYSMMLEIQSHVSFEVQSDFRSVTRGCNELFDQLKNLVGQLEKEITRTRARAQVEQMRELTEVGRAHARLIASSVPTVEINALVTGWALVGEQVGRTAQNLLPAGENVLSTDASRILNEIVKLVHQSIPEQQALIIETQKRTSALVNALRERIGSVEDYLQEASQAAVVADNHLSKHAEAVKARATAADLTARAITDLQALKTIVTQNCTGKCDETLAAIDDLNLLLEGTKQWIKEPDKVLAFNAATGAGELAGKALARQGRPSYAHPLLVERLDSVLARHCPPGSSLQTALCTTLVLLPVKGWAWWSRPARDQLVYAVERGLVRARRTLACEGERPLAEDIVSAGLV